MWSHFSPGVALLLWCLPSAVFASESGVQPSDLGAVQKDERDEPLKAGKGVFRLTMETHDPALGEFADALPPLEMLLLQKAGRVRLDVMAPVEAKGVRVLILGEGGRKALYIYVPEEGRTRRFARIFLEEPFLGSALKFSDLESGGILSEMLGAGERGLEEDIESTVGDRASGEVETHIQIRPTNKSVKPQVLSPTLLEQPLFGTGVSSLPKGMQLSGWVEPSLHYRLARKDLNDTPSPLALRKGISRQALYARVDASQSLGAFRLVADVEADWLRHPAEDETFRRLPRDAGGYDDFLASNKREHVAWIWPRRLFLEGVSHFGDAWTLRSRLGYQQINWGMADRINPTAAMTSVDLENPLRFGERRSNLTWRVDLLETDISETIKNAELSFAWMPFFQAPLLPPSARLGVSQIDRIPVIDETLRYRLHAERMLAAESGFPASVTTLRIREPKRTLGPGQFGASLRATIWGQDVGVSYQKVRLDTLLPIENRTRQVSGANCLQTLGAGCGPGALANEVTIGFPKADVFGFNVAGQITKHVGYRVEAALYQPNERRLRLYQDDISILGLERPAGEYVYPAGEAPVVMPDDVYAKWVVGLDMRPAEGMFTTVMWVHGLPDEYGGSGVEDIRRATPNDAIAPLGCVITLDGRPCTDEIRRSRVGDYIVLGTDFRTLSGALRLRLFTLWDVTGYASYTYDEFSDSLVKTKHAPWTAEGRSVVLYPSADFFVGYGLSVGMGAVLNIGQVHTKFGDLAVGGSLGFIKATARF